MRGVLALVTCGVLLVAAGCAKDYYRVRDTRTGDVYVTQDLRPRLFQSDPLRFHDLIRDEDVVLADADVLPYLAKDKARAMIAAGPKAASGSSAIAADTGNTKK